MSEPVQYGLIVSFPDQSDSFVHGYEAGMLATDMRRGDVAEIERTVHSANREVITRLCMAEGWSVRFTPTDYSEWDEVLMVKSSQAHECPNPRGLRLVQLE